MAEQYKPAARPEPPRQRLTTLWQLLGIAVVIAIVLVLIFPGSTAVKRSVPSKLDVTGGASAPGKGADPADLAYLKKLVQDQPKNPEHRFTLAQKQNELGDIAAARAALEPLYNSPDPAVRQRARLADLRLQMQQMNAFQPGSAERQREMDRLRQEVAAMAQYEWSLAGLLDLADFAGQLGARKTRADLYLRIARSEQASREWLDKAASAVLGDGEYQTAAEIYFTAQQRATSREDQRHYFISGVKALQAGNMMREASAAADKHIGPLGDDDETLRFVIRLARAANDLPRAQRFTKRLLRMSAASSHGSSLLEQLLSALVPSAHAADLPVSPSPAAVKPGTLPPPAPPTAPPPKPVPMRPYDAQNFPLAYDVFVSAGNLDDAYRVAEVAVRAVPNDLAWRQRFAQVAEWSNRPQQGLEQWVIIARRTGRADAWRAVMRLAPGLFADEELLEALQWQAARGGPLTAEQSRAMVDAFERVGRPREGVAFLEREYKRRPNASLLELQALLYERMGDIDAAIAANRRLIQAHGTTTERVSNLATLLIARGDYKGAYEIIQAHRAKVKPEDAEYWRLLADLALVLQQDKDATQALETLVKSGKATPDDFGRLITLLEPTQPVVAARLAETAYEKFKTPDFLVLALGIHAGRGDYVAMRRLLARLTPEEEQALERNAAFLAARASYRAGTGATELAHADYRLALRLDPGNLNLRITYLFFLIDQRNLAQLRRELAAYPEVMKDPAYDGVMGAAWLALDEPVRAIEHYKRQLRANPNDYLWTLSYADALEQNNEPDMAWRVRRHAWFQVRRELQARQGPPPPDLVQAYARMAIQNNPGDPAHVVIRELMRMDGADAAADPNRRGLTAGTRDLVLSWALSTEQNQAAKVWLWKQYGKNMAKPAWAEVPVALAENDIEAARDLLDRKFDSIPRYDRQEAAAQSQQFRLAQDIAFVELERHPHDDEMHLRLTNSVLEMYNSTELGFTWFKRGPLGGREYTAEYNMWLSPRLRLSVDVSYIDERTIDTSTLAYVPSADRLYGVTALWRHAIGETRISVFHRLGMSETTGARLVHSRPIIGRTTGRIGLAYQERALETAALAAGGMRDRAFVGVDYPFSKREYAAGELSASRYYTQERTKIGSGQQLAWELGHRFRTEYPDWHVRAAGTVNRYSRNGSGDETSVAMNPLGTVPDATFFLPQNFSTYGLYTGFGTFYLNNYTRAIRPFLDVGVLHNTVTGNGYGFMAGASGSVFGADRLTAYVSTGQGGSGINVKSREAGVRYMYMFDRF